MHRRRFLFNCLTVPAGLLTIPSLPGLLAEDDVQVANLETTPLGPALKIARTSLAKFDAVSDYEADFVKRELFGKKLKDASIRVKVRQQPFSVYMRFGKPHEGREVIFVEGANGGMLLAHESGLKSIVGTLSLDPEAKRAMEDNHHPITRFGMKNLLQGVIAQWETDTLIDGVQVAYFPKATVGEVACKAIETKHPAPVKGAVFHVTRLYIEAESGLPIRVQQYNFPRKSGDELELHEEYTYLKVKTNVGLTDLDFDVTNPNYNY